MNTGWNAFLAQQGAHIEEDIVLHFGDAAGELLAARDGTMLCDLSQFGVLCVSGADAQNFLQNLLSSDVNAITPAAAQYSSFNSAKGRMLATFLAWRQGTEYFLQLPRSLCGAVHKKLSLYILRSKVKIADVSDQLVCLGLAGRDANTLAKQTFGVIPETALGATPAAGAMLLRLDTGRWMIAATLQQAPALWASLKCGATPAGSTCWDWLNIRAGIPVILPATQEQFVPQMANLDLIGGVSFRKGCYPGQEIVARMQYLGKLKRRMYLAHVAGAARAGDELYSTEMEGQSCGMVANASPAPGGGYDLLAVVQVASHDAHRVHLGSLDGEILAFQPLPGAFPG